MRRDCVIKLKERTARWPIGRSLAGARARLIAAVMAMLTCLMWVEVSGKAEASVEYAVKAAFIYNFARFAEWPVSAFKTPSDPIVVCVLGQDPFDRQLDEAMRGKAIAQHRFAVVRIASAEEARDCHIVFISRSESSRLAGVLDAVRDKPVMTIGDMEDAAQRGAVLNFLIENGRVRFAINTDTAKRSGLVLSSQLIKLATVVSSPTSAP